jgi:hypothetical protein
MGSWFKRQQPIQLKQWSELPYVILKNGVFLCFDNCYGESVSRETHHIIFQTSRVALHRQSTNFFRLTEFPCLIPFADIIELDNVVRGGKVETASHGASFSQSIALVRGGYAARHADMDLDNYDHAFVLVKDNVPDEIREILNCAEILHHRQWYRTAVSIADQICPNRFRGYCWTNTIRELSVDCYGLKREDIDMLCESFNGVGIRDFSTQWMG